MLSAGLTSGDIEVGYTGGTTVLGGAAAGTELKMVAGFVSRGRGFLTVRPEIRRPADLLGKRFGVQSIGGTLWMYAMLTLEQLGLDIGARQDTIFVVGDQTVMIRALESWHRRRHGVDDPHLQPGSQEKGLQRDERKYFRRWHQPASSPAKSSRKNPSTTENIMKALIEAEYYHSCAGGKHKR